VRLVESGHGFFGEVAAFGDVPFVVVSTSTAVTSRTMAGSWGKIPTTLVRLSPSATSGSSRSPSKGAAPAYASVPRRTLTPECVGTPSGGSTDTSTMGNAATSMSAGTAYRPSARTGPRDTMPSTFGSMSHTS